MPSTCAMALTNVTSVFSFKLAYFSSIDSILVYFVLSLFNKKNTIFTGETQGTNQE